MKNFLFVLRYCVAALFLIANEANAQEGSICVPPGFPTFGVPGGTINISDLPDNLPNVFGVEGTLVVNENAEWLSKQVYMQAAAQIIISPSITFTLRGSTLEGCDYMWKGIFMPGNASLDINSGSRISDAVSAVEVQGWNTINVNGGTLTRNFYGMYFHDLNTPAANAPPFFLTSLVIDGHEPLKTPYVGQPTSLYGMRTRVGVYFHNYHYFRFNGGLTVTIKKCEIGAWLNESTGTLSEVRFEEIQWPSPKYPGIGIYLTNSPPSLSISNNAFFLSNQFMKCHQGILMDKGNAVAYFNIMNKMNTGIRSKNSINVWLNGNQITGVNEGVVFENSINGFAQIKNTQINDVSTHGIYIAETTGSPNSYHYDISGNTISVKGNEALTPLPNDNSTGILINQSQVNSNSSMLVKSNYIYLPGSNTGLNNTGILLRNCWLPAVKKNHIIQDIPNAAAMHCGINSIFSEGGIIECNDLLNTDKGLIMSGSRHPTNIRTNQFKFHTSGGMLFTGLNAADHTHQGNLWLYPTSAANPGAISDLSAADNGTMQFIVDGQENQAFHPFVVGDNWFVAESTPDPTIGCDPYNAVPDPSNSLSSDNSSEDTQIEIWNSSSERANKNSQEMPNEAIEITVFPNPSNGNFTVSAPIFNAAEARLDLFDLSGRIVFSKQIAGMPVQVDTEGLGSGMYFVRVSDMDQKVLGVVRVVIQ